MDDFTKTGRQYAKTMAGQLGAFTTSMVQADSMAKDAAAERFFNVADRPNINIQTEVSIIGSDTPFTIGVSVPPVMVTKTGPIEIKEAKLSLGMNINVHSESAKDKDVKIDSETKVSGGWGPLKFSQTIRSAVGIRSSQKRSTDKSAHCDVDMTMGQSDAPEGQMIILDAFATCMKRTMDLNMALVERQVQAAEETVEPPPPPPEDRGEDELVA